MGDLKHWARACVTAMALIGMTGCGGGAGKTAVVGLANGGNRIFNEGGVADALASELADHAGTPVISDALLGEVFDSIVEQARDGDPEAALIVFRVAAAQRGEGDDD